MGPMLLSKEENGIKYLEKQGLIDKKDNITHICWATGGSLVPENIMDGYYKKGELLNKRRAI